MTRKSTKYGIKINEIAKTTYQNNYTIFKEKGFVL